MNNMNPLFLCDGYKLMHHQMYPEGTTLVYSNFTPRSNKYAQGIEKVVSFGQQYFVRWIKEQFDNNFFLNSNLSVSIARDNQHHPQSKEMHRKVLEKAKEPIISEIKTEFSTYVGSDFDTIHIEKLWNLGYLPLEFKALEEGALVPMGVPVLTVKNTHPDFAWLVNYMETILSNILWKPMTSAAIALEYKRLLTEYAKKTDPDNLGIVDFQAHDFSMRGMSGVDATVLSGLGHITSFSGSDNIPVISNAKKYYDAEGFIMGGVPATEHSVICAGTKEDEIGTFKRMLKKFPIGILSMVSDTWDLWKVLTEYLPELKEEILARDGKLVCRPDSGDPVDIICGTDWLSPIPSELRSKDFKEGMRKSSQKGVIELLWDTFGGTINKQGYKVLDPHIGVIYGDSITLDRAGQICQRLEAKGFASTNIVFGIGSYTYNMNSRDTFGMAMKATYVEIKKQCDCTDDDICHPDPCKSIEVEGRKIFKDPITDDGTKKSAKGLLMVESNGKLAANSPLEYKLVDQVSWEDENKGALQTIFKDGKFYNETNLEEIRNRISKLV